MATELQVSTASDEMVPGFVALSETHYENEPASDPEVVRWRHLGAPSGPSVTVELVDGSDRVGRMWILKHRWSVLGEVRTAANPVDFLIREDHRRLPKFLSLFKGTMNEAHRGADLVFHTSNPLTDDLYRKLMKFEPVTELDGALLPTRPFAVARAADVVDMRFLGAALDVAFGAVVRLVGLASRVLGVTLSAIAPLADVEAMYAALRSEETVCNARFADDVSWRFRGAGTVSYERRWIRSGGRVVGCVVTTDRSVNGIRGRFVVDLVWPGGPKRRSIRAMWTQVGAAAAADRIEAVFFLANLANTRLARLAIAPMISVGRDRLPQRVPVFVRTTPGPAALALTDVDWSSAYLVLADFDMF